MLEKAIRGSQTYWGWLIFLLLVIGVGAGNFIYQFFEGLKITGMSRDVSWGLYIAQFTYLVGVAASGVMVVLPYYPFWLFSFGCVGLTNCVSAAAGTGAACAGAEGAPLADAVTGPKATAQLERPIVSPRLTAPERPSAANAS